jgi:hypothetical protein
MPSAPGRPSLAPRVTSAISSLTSVITARIIGEDPGFREDPGVGEEKWTRELPGNKVAILMRGVVVAT